MAPSIGGVGADVYGYETLGGAPVGNAQPASPGGGFEQSADTYNGSSGAGAGAAGFEILPMVGDSHEADSIAIDRLLVEAMQEAQVKKEDFGRAPASVSELRAKVREIFGKNPIDMEAFRKLQEMMPALDDPNFDAHIQAAADGLNAELLQMVKENALSDADRRGFLQELGEIMSTKGRDELTQDNASYGAHVLTSLANGSANASPGASGSATGGTASAAPTSGSLPAGVYVGADGNLHRDPPTRFFQPLPADILPIGELFRGIPMNDAKPGTVPFDAGRLQQLINDAVAGSPTALAEVIRMMPAAGSPTMAQDLARFASVAGGVLHAIERAGGATGRQLDTFWYSLALRGPDVLGGGKETLAAFRREHSMAVL